ncbi:MAG: phage holin family protein, partial [Verrucomicrobiae bacterium]|nr:phage holin family protein [Verrucomicrobiae bacterium]
MSDSEGRPAGVLDAARRIVGSLLEIARNRVELFAVELRIEQARFLVLLAAVGVALLLALMGVVVIAVLVAMLVWDAARVIGLVVLALGLLAGACLVFWLIWRWLQTAPKPFPETIAQLQKDCA